MADPLVAFLLEQLAEDERVATAALDASSERWWPAIWVGDEQNIAVVTTRQTEMVDGSDVIAARCGPDYEDGTEKAAHIALFDPKRMLAEVAANDTFGHGPGSAYAGDVLIPAQRESHHRRSVDRVNSSTVHVPVTICRSLILPHRWHRRIRTVAGSRRPHEVSR